MNRLTELGAELHQEGENWNAADILARAACQADPKAKYLNPFDDPLLWTGHASVVHEISKKLKPDMIICSAGGGGLFNGIRQGLREAYDEDGDLVPVVVAETIGCDSLNQAIKNSTEGFKIPGITSIAKSLGSTVASSKSYEETLKTNTHSATVSDAETIVAIRQLCETERVLVEPACAVERSQKT